MALKRLTTGEMLSLTATWTDAASPERAILGAIPQVAGLLPQVDAAHTGLLHTQPDAATPPRLRAIQEEQRALDARHDAVLHGCHAMLSGLAHLAADPVQSSTLEALLRTLLPDGLVATQRTYREEAGQAALLASRLTNADLMLLEAIPAFGKSLSDFVTEWMELGQKLGKLEDERGSLTNGAPTPADAFAARNRWIRAVNAVRTVLELVGVDVAAARPLLQRIEEAERKAARRASEQAREAAEPAPEAPTTTTAPTQPAPVTP